MNEATTHPVSPFAMRIEHTHPVQFGYLAVMLVLDSVGLIWINALKQVHRQRGQSPAWNWTTKRNTYWALIGALVACNCYLDAHFAIDTLYLLQVKSYITAFPVGLLDLYFSEVYDGLSPVRVLIGATGWCACQAILARVFIDFIAGHHVTPMIVRDLSVETAIRFVVSSLSMMAGVGFFADLIFSPVHRILHRREIYQGNHSVHHEYTNKISSLVLYHGTTLDDCIMPLTAAVGLAIWWWLSHRWINPSSNINLYMAVTSMLFSHAHDQRCAHIIIPLLPDDLNLVAYHHMHHIHPTKNFGLTKPSDMIWDWFLNVDTIYRPSVLTKDETRASTTPREHNSQTTAAGRRTEDPFKEE